MTLREALVKYPNGWCGPEHSAPGCCIACGGDGRRAQLIWLIGDGRERAVLMCSKCMGRKWDSMEAAIAWLRLVMT